MITTRCGPAKSCCARAGAVLLWHDTIDTIAQRRLQLAAETGDGSALVYRRLTRRDTASVAALRLTVASVAGSPPLDVLKCRGARPTPAYALAACSLHALALSALSPASGRGV